MAEAAPLEGFTLAAAFDALDEAQQWRHAAQGVSPRITGIGAEAVCNAMVAACHARLYLEVGMALVQQCARAAAVWVCNV